MLETKTKFSFDTAGWTFFFIVFAVIVVPCIWVSFQLVGEWASVAYPIIMGVVLASFGAGFVSWAVNAVLHQKRKKAKLKERKLAKKRK